MATGDLTTLANVKDWLTITGSADDARITRVVTAASQFMQKWLSRTITPATSYSEKRNGNGKSQMMLRNYPIVSVASVAINGVSIPAAPSSTASGYLFDDDTIYLNGYDFGKSPQGVAVSYTAGFAAVPPDLEQACIELVSLRLKERTRVGEVSKNLGGEVVAFSQKDISDDIRTILQQYKRVFMPLS